MGKYEILRGYRVWSLGLLGFIGFRIPGRTHSAHGKAAMLQGGTFNEGQLPAAFLKASVLRCGLHILPFPLRPQLLNHRMLMSLAACPSLKKESQGIVARVLAYNSNSVTSNLTHRPLSSSFLGFIYRIL